MVTREQEEFLLTIRRSLGHPGQTPPVDRERLLGPMAGREDKSSLWAKLESQVHEQRASLVQSLERELSRVGGKVTRIPSHHSLEEYLEGLVSRDDVKRVVRWDSPLLSEVEPALAKGGATVTLISGEPEDPQSRAEVRDTLISADLGITEVDYAIADTGTLVLVAWKTQSRLVSLLPPVHVALLRPSFIVPTMADLLPVLNAAAREDPVQLSSCITFITGPSRTADIEKIITVGVHGPKELHLLILEYT